MKIVRSADDIILYEIIYTDDMSVFDNVYLDDDVQHIMNIHDEKLAEGIAIGVLYGSDSAIYSAVTKQTFGYNEEGIYCMKECEVLKEYFADEIQEKEEKVQGYS